MVIFMTYVSEKETIETYPEATLSTDGHHYIQGMVLYVNLSSKKKLKNFHIFEITLYFFHSKTIFSIVRYTVLHFCAVYRIKSRLNIK